MKFAFLSGKAAEFKLTLKVIISLGFLFLFYLVLNYGYIRWMSVSKISDNLKIINDLVIKDLEYQDGKWDTSKYIADTKIPYDNPLYVITTEGFVIGQLKPINGFLDTADFEYASSFTKPQTVISPANESWRLFSKTIQKNSKVYGAILVAYFQPKESAIKEIDRELVESADFITSKITINDGKIDLSNLDVTELDFFIYYLIVDTFNKILKTDGSPPAFIDRSFVAQEIKKTGKPREIEDNITGEKFLVLSKPITDEKNSLIGLVISGKSLKSTYNVLQHQLIFSLSSGSVVLFIIFFLGLYLFQRELVYFLKQPKKINKVIEINQKMDGQVVAVIDNKEYKISKPEFDSDSDKFIEKLLRLSKDKKELIYKDCGRTPLSKLVTRLGFTGLLRKIFFPRTAKQMVKFRKYLTQEDLKKMKNISLESIIKELTKS